MQQSISMSPALILDARAELGEGPRWHAREKRLYWVDIARNELHRFDPATGVDECRRFSAPVGCFAFRAGGGMVLAMKDGFATVADWASAPVPFGPQILAEQPDLRFNDGRTDPAGRFWAGTVDGTKHARLAALYRLDPDARLERIEGGMLTCNGAAFTADGRRFFHADTPSHAIRVYDCDPAGGTLSGMRVLHRFPLGQGRPDGGSVDAEGCYWTALFDGGRVVRLSPEGEILAQIALPAKRPTMIAFGGEDLRTAYVTSARVGMTAQELAEQPLSGGIFTFRVDVPGVPEWPFAGAG